MNIEKLCFKFENNILTVGLFDLKNNPISTFDIKDIILLNKETKSINLTNNSFKACQAFKNFFIIFDQKEYSFKEAIDFFNENNYHNLTGII